MSQVKPEKVISQLATTILKNAASITQRLINRVSQDKEIPTSDALTHIELLDHLPRLFEELSAFLQEQPQEESIIKGEIELKAAKIVARIHGHHRLVQGYNIYEVVRELGIMHSLIASEEVTNFAQQFPDCTYEIEKQAHRLINEFFNSTMATSVEQFAKEADTQAKLYQTQLEDANKQLQETNERLHQIDLSRLSLVRTIAHEMDNLLNAIISPIKLLHNSFDETQRSKLFEMIQRNTYDMGTLLNQLNDYSASLAGQEQLTIDFFELTPLISELVDIFQPLASEKGISFDTDIHKTAGLYSDRLKLKRIMTNLLTNAVKYTAQGHIKLTVKSPGNLHYNIIIEDTGEGISEENISRLFTEFQHFTPSNDLPGSGLGLAITKRLVELLQGQIMVESRHGTGSRFEIIIPLTIKKD